jgi:release factor glutamine methyltransferase
MFAESMMVGEAIDWGADTLDRADDRARNTRADSMLLLRHVLGIPAAEFYAERERQLTSLQTQTFNALIRERAKGMPIQYIIGVQEFFGLQFHVTPDVLIPRPETEHLVEAAIARLKDHPTPRIADVGTGSGAIAIALAHALPRAQIVALDISAAALKIAEQNAVQNGVAERICFLQSDLLAAIAGESFDAIVSNPPYIAESERKTLPKEVRDYEPPQALFAGPTGLECYRRLIPAAQQQLVSGGWLLMEIADGHRDAITAMLPDWEAVEFIPDLQGIPRVSVASKQVYCPSRPHDSGKN